MAEHWHSVMVATGSDLESELGRREPDLSGSLRVFTLSDVLQMVALSGQSGTLTLVEGWNSRAVTFERGRIVYLAAATRLPSVEELLMSSGTVTPEQISQAAAQGFLIGQSITGVLRDWGLITAADLLRCQDQQLEETIYSLFLWRNGRFTFTRGEMVVQGGLAVDLVSERIIIDATRRVDEWIAISPTIPSVRLIFRPVAPLPDGRQDRVEQAVYAALDGQRDVVALAKACGQTQFDTARALNGLVGAGCVVAVPPDKFKIIELFNFLVEAIYVKLVMYGHSDVALQFERELNRFANENGLKVRLRAGKVVLSDRDTPIQATNLIDLYKLFIAIEQNKFSRMFPPDIVHGLILGLYNHVSADLRDMMRVYEFYQIEGLLPPPPCCVMRDGSRCTQHVSRSTQHVSRSTQHAAHSTQHAAQDGDVPQAAGDPGLQDLRPAHRAHLRRGHDRHRRPQRLGQE